MYTCAFYLTRVVFRIDLRSCAMKQALSHAPMLMWQGDNEPVQIAGLSSKNVQRLAKRYYVLQADPLGLCTLRTALFHLNSIPGLLPSLQPSRESSTMNEWDPAIEEEKNGDGEKGLTFFAMNSVQGRSQGWTPSTDSRGPQAPRDTAGPLTRNQGAPIGPSKKIIGKLLKQDTFSY